jgi:hypothetical protein|tara:strand:- start:630 stop:950 length:321 start_codon:yes stop_codon:yes gene_type:complete
MEETENPTTSTSGDDNTTAIVAYITIIGFIVAIVLHTQKKTLLGAYHLRQMMGLLLLSIGFTFIPIVNLFAWVFSLVLWVFGLMNAVNKKQEPVPLLGSWFKGAFT